MFQNGNEDNLDHLVHTFQSGDNKVKIYRNGYLIRNTSRDNPGPTIVRISGGNLFVGIVNNGPVYAHFNQNGQLNIVDVVIFTPDLLNGLQHTEMIGNLV